MVLKELEKRREELQSLLIAALGISTSAICHCSLLSLSLSLACL